MKNTIITPALVAFLGLALAGAPLTVQAQTTNAPAATAPAKAKTNKINLTLSTITAIDTTANTVTVDNKTRKDGDKTLVLTVDATTKVTRDHKEATLADFKVGEKVTGSYVTEASGSLTASKLTFTTPKPKAPKKAPAADAAPAAAPAPAATPATQ